jgi:hypothetical protein
MTEYDPDSNGSRGYNLAIRVLRLSAVLDGRAEPDPHCPVERLLARGHAAPARRIINAVTHCIDDVNPERAGFDLDLQAVLSLQALRSPVASVA